VTSPDPLLRGLTWGELAAHRRPLRLKRNRHFRGEVRDLQAAASAAAAELGCAVRTLRDELGRRNRYVWLQFADGSVPLGSPCPRCVGRELERTHDHFGTCLACGARLILTARLAEPEVVDEPTARPPDRRRLSGWSDVELVRDDGACDETAERWWGRGVDGQGVTMLLQVEYTLEEGRRVPDPDVEGEDLHRVRFWKLGALQRAARLGVLDEWPGAAARDGNPDEELQL
jgi:hypothetical protein